MIVVARISSTMLNKSGKFSSVQSKLPVDQSFQYVSGAECLLLSETRSTWVE